MKKISFLFLFIVSIIVQIQAQVGVNTENPTGIFHIHVGTTASTVNDVVVLKNGNVGIGTVTPQNKLEIVPPAGHGNTGLRLPLSGSVAAGDGLVAADTNGNVKWASVSAQYQTVALSSVSGAITTPDLTTSRLANGDFNLTGLEMFKLANLDYLQVDNVTGNLPGGWDTAKSQYLVPRDGYYRISLAVYFLSNIPANTMGPYNNRAYIARTPRQDLTTPGTGPASLYYECGFVSVTDAGSDVIGYTSGIGLLNQNDIIDVRLVCQYAGVYNAGALNGQWVTSHAMKYWAGIGHTYIVIELLSTI